MPDGAEEREIRGSRSGSIRNCVLRPAERLQDLRMQRRRCGRHQAWLPDDVLIAVDCTEHPAGFPNTGNYRCDIPWIHAWIDRHIDAPLA